EFLYFAMGDHLDLLRMQFPPLIAVAARLLDALTGTTVLATRLAASLAGAAYLLVTVLIARDMGGARRAQLLAGVGVLVSPVFLRAGTLFQPVVFEQVWWLVACWALVRLLREDGPGWWIVLGVALGLAALTKFSAAFLAAGVLAAVLLSPRRADLREPWPWYALGIAVLIGLPSLTGQMTWDWPFLAQARELRASQLARVSALDFVGGQFMLLAGAAPLALLGLMGLLLGRALQGWRALEPWRPLGALVVVAAALFLALGGKAYYLAPVHGLLIGAGAVQVERWLGRGPSTAPPVLAGAMCALGVLVLPIAVPVLAPDGIASYAARLGMTKVTETNTGTQLELPQDFADMLGWEEQVAAVAEVYGGLTPEERARVTVLGTNYGRAGALQHYGPRHGLPRPVSLAGDFYHWGPGDRPGDLLIVVGGDPATLSQLFRSVTLVRTVRNPRGVEEEREVPIFVVRDPVQDFRETWRRMGPQWG
ncbi:MAG TPA: glycosyltransferase family 39 protein, partial [Gemmatimonadales bacterium]|nr:glycosyltransferase family 39 protein [Gemmatimonadales bacterium]